MDKVLRNRSNIKKPTKYIPDMNFDDPDNESVDSDWDISSINSVEEEDGYDEKKENYEYDDFVVSDNEVEYSKTESDEESEYEFSDSE